MPIHAPKLRMLSLVRILSDHIRPHYFQRIIAMPLQMSPSLDAVEPKHSLARKRSRSDSSNLGPMARGVTPLRGRA